MIPISKPSADDQTKQDLLEVLDSGWWGKGPKVEEFEKKFAEYVGQQYAVAVNSATSALDLCLKAADISGGELYTTPLTFVSDAIVGEWNNMTVTFGDIDPETLCLDPKSFYPSKNTKAVIAVDSHGRLADIDGFRKKFNGLIIEDAAHAMYTPGAGKGDMTVWSFQAVKTLPCGDGGMITTNNKKYYDKLKSLTWLGIEKPTFSRVSDKGYQWDYDIFQSGIKAYMNDLTAVIGLGQLRRLDEMNAWRRGIQDQYNEAFKNHPHIKIPAYSHTVQYYTPRFKDRDELCQYLASKGICSSVHFKPLTEMDYWRKHSRSAPIPNVYRIWPELLSLPVYYGLTGDEVNHIIKTVLDFYG